MGNARRGWMTEQEVDAFIGKNAGYYKEKWKSHPDTHYYKGWNVVAIAFFLEWAAYRKMYTEAILTFLGVLTFAVILSFLPIGNDIPEELFGQTIKFLLGFSANGLYRRKALRVVNKSLYMPDDAKMKYLENKGGTNVIGVVICIILEIGIVLLPSLLNRI